MQHAGICGGCGNQVAKDFNVCGACRAVWKNPFAPWEKAYPYVSVGVGFLIAFAFYDIYDFTISMSRLAVVFVIASLLAYFALFCFLSIFSKYRWWL